MDREIPLRQLSLAHHQAGMLSRQKPASSGERSGLRSYRVMACGLCLRPHVQEVTWRKGGQRQSEEGLTRSGDWPTERAEKGGSSNKGA